MHGWMDGLREWRKRGWEARGWAEKLISDSPWVSHYYGYCVIRFRICKALTMHSPAAASTFLVKVRLSLNYSLSLCLPACPLAPVHPETELARKRMTVRMKRERRDMSGKNYRGI